jgi:hypothetical protein
MRKILLFLTALPLVFVVPANAHHGPAKTVINAAAKKQPGVPFDHKKHSETLVKTCDTCHHTNKGMTNANATGVKVAKCTTCHLDPKGKVPSMRDMSLTANPFHKNCIGCHKTQKKGPTVCKDCHKK